MVTIPVREDNDPTFLPELQLKGSTSGEAKASVGWAWWFPIGETSQDPKVRPHSFTAVLDFAAETDGGAAKLLLGQSESDSPLSAPVSWSVGLSIGLLGNYTARELFPGTYAPTKEDSVAMETAIHHCRLACSAPKTPGCESFDEFRKEAKADLAVNWLDNHVGTQRDPTKLKAKLIGMLTGVNGGEKCEKARRDTSKKIDSYATAPENFVGAKQVELALGIVEAVDVCRNECVESSDTSDDCRLIAGTAADIGLATVVTAFNSFPGSDQICEAAKPIGVKPVGNEDRARYQKWQVAIGGALALTPHKYLVARTDDNGETQTVDVPTADGGVITRDLLKEDKTTHVGAKFGASAARLSLSGMTIEGRFLGSVKGEPSANKAEWCTVEGLVGEDEMAPAAEVCKTLPFGEPTTSFPLSVDLYFGYANLRKGTYRVSAGPRLASTDGFAKKSDWSLGFRIPVAFNLLAAERKEGKLDYDGLLRVTGFLDHVWKGADEEDDEWVGGISLELLGKRSLFSTRYDEL